MDYLPNNATIDEACEWLQHQTGQKWTLPRLLEDGHLTPYVWIDYIPGMPQISGDRREGYLTMMVYHGDVMRLAADRNEALLTMFTAHDGTPVLTKPGWRVELKDIRFKKEALERVAEIINNTAPAQTAPPALKVAETVAQRRTRWLAMFEAEEKRDKRGALQRVADSEKVDRSNMKKDIDKALAARDKQKRAGFFVSHLVQDGKRKG